MDHKIDVLSSIQLRNITRNGDEYLLTFTGFIQDQVLTVPVSPPKLLINLVEVSVGIIEERCRFSVGTSKNNANVNS